MSNATWDRKRAAHLYRRAGFGARPDELDRAVALGREGAVSHLVDYDAIPIDDFEAYMTTFGFDLEDPSGPADAYEGYTVAWWYKRMQYSPRPLEEKMTLFWHGHFATSSEKAEPRMMYVQNQIFRRLGLGKFEDLLLAVSRDPAMLIWLDGASNVKGAPNENFAREVMELFTMGVGHYTQQDVTESARAYTGWTIDYGNNPYQFVYDPNQHDGGLKVFLGRYDNYTGEDIIAILASRPETAAFVTGKLARFLLGDDPSPALAAGLQDLFTKTKGNIREVVRAILLSDDFDVTADEPDMIKSPVEFIVGAYRQLGAWADGFFFWPDQMGQAIFRPPNVGGWRGGRFWASTGSLMLRINFAWVTMSQSSPQGDTFRWEPRRFFEGRSFASPDEIIDFLVDRLNVVTLSDTLRAALRDYVSRFGEPFPWTPPTYDNVVRGVIFVLMSSPEYQMQ